MVVWLIVLIASLGLSIWSVLAFGRILTLPLLAGALGVVIAILSVIRRRLRRPVPWVVVDGSNVLYWEDETPSLHSVRLVIEKLVANGLEPIVWFDANVGYLVRNQYMGPARLSKVLRYPVRQISVAPKGTPADPLLIEDAQNRNARIVTNDRFRDWAERYPQVLQSDLFLRGTINRRSVTLELDNCKRGPQDQSHDPR